MSAEAKNKVTVTLDGEQYEFEEGTTILEAAKSVGIDIPHYCYHQGLSIAGACRMCLVEIEKVPKLQIACYMTVGDGMVIHTSNERVRLARKAMLEFHLVNHPVDCPVCDQAGECWLQIYYMQHGRYISRLRENKVKKTKKAVPIGPHVVLDQERCILCSRCVRFCREISKSHELGMFKRGDREYIDIFDGMEIDNPYSACVNDICPVGALTDRHFRFRTRVWYLEIEESVCPRCSRGCNIFLDYNLKRSWKYEGRRLARVRPRYNGEVNDWWMCDEGRYSFYFVDDEDRLTEPLARGDNGLEPAEWKIALEEAARELTTAAAGSDGEAAVLVSPQGTNEELFLLRTVLADRLPGVQLAFTTENSFEKTGDDLLRLADKNPNTTGAKMLGLTDAEEGVWDLDELESAADEGRLKALMVCYNDLTALPGERGGRWSALLDKVPRVIFLGTNGGGIAAKADVVLPAAAFPERTGTVTNFEGRVQLQRRAFDPAGDSLPGWEIIRRLGEELEGSYEFGDVEEVFRIMTSQVPAFEGLDYDKIGPGGRKAARVRS